MGAARALLRGSRPGNAAMAAAGVATGASLFLGAEAHWGSVGLAAASAAMGLAAGNLMNDALDLDVDRTAHPDRPLPRGELSPDLVVGASGGLFVLALLSAFAANLLVGMLAGVLVVWLVSYELALKRRGFIGNLWVSLVVATTFALGAAAAGLPPFSTRPQELEAMLRHPRFVVPLVLSLLAFLANTAREIFKDVEDAAADRGVRMTLPLRVGSGRAMAWGRAFLVATVVYAVAGLLRHADLGPTVWIDGALLAPSLALFVVAAFQGAARAAQRWTKVGMVAALAGLFVMGFV